MHIRCLKISKLEILFIKQIMQVYITINQLNVVNVKLEMPQMNMECVKLVLKIYLKIIDSFFFLT